MQSIDHSIAIGYLLTDAFCGLLLFMVFRSSQKTSDHSRQHKWFNVSLRSQLIYIILDVIVSFIPKASLIQNRGLTTLCSVALITIFNIFCYAAFIQYNLGHKLKTTATSTRRKLTLPAAIIILASVIVYSLASHPFSNKIILSVFLVCTALIYYVWSLLINARAESKKPKDITFKKYLTDLSFLAIFGLLALCYPTVPIISVASTVYLLFTYYKYISSNYINSLSDNMTDLRNRDDLLAFTTQIQDNNTSNNYYLFMIDLTGLKSLNDTEGHLEGDRSLHLVSEVLEKLTQQRNGMACRYGGDEFIAIVPLTSENQALAFKELLQEEIREASSDTPLLTPPKIACGYAKLGPKEKFDYYVDQAAVEMNSEKRKIENNDEESEFFTDKVTGLPNINYFYNFSKKKLSEFLLDDKTPALVLIGITGMRTYSNRFGYKSGDQLLLELTQILTKSFPNDVLIRYINYDFVLLTADPNLFEKLNNLREEFNQKSYGSSLQAGIYYYHSAKEDTLSAVNKARQAMDFLSEDHSKGYQVYDKSVIDSVANRTYVLTNFKKALEEKWIQPFYQVEVRSLTGKICSAEALARWIDPERGMLAPNAFVSVLEESGQVYLLDLEILRQVCETISHRLQKNLPVIPISFNISRVDLQVCDIFAEVEKVRKRYNVPSSYLKVEILESAPLSTPEKLREVINKFHEAGYEVWMDDFGSGYSTLNNLMDFKFDMLKIDMGFLRDFDKNSESRILIASIVDMAKHLGLHTVCEGVETQEQASFLREIGCQRQQGYLYSKPISLNDLLELIKSKGSDSYEDIDQNQYFDEITQSNFLSNPLLPFDTNGSGMSGYDSGLLISLIEEENGQINVLFNNQACNDVLKSLNSKHNSLQEHLNKNPDLHSFITKKIKEAHSTKKLITSDSLPNNEQYHFGIRHLASYKDKDAYIIALQPV